MNPASLLPGWFVGVEPTLVEASGARRPLGVETMNPHGGSFHLPEGSGVELGKPIEIEFRNPETGTVCAIESWVTSRRDNWFRVTFVGVLRHVPGPKGRPVPEKRLTCDVDYPPLAWADHPFYDKTRLQFHVRDFFKNGMTLSFRQHAKAPVESLPLHLTIVLPGMETLQTSVRVVSTLLAPQESLCMVEFLEPTRELYASIGRYLFTASTVSVDLLEELGYEVPDFEFASIFNYARTPEAMREMLELRLLAYRSREGANVEAIATPDAMRDRFDDHSLILSVRVGGKPLGTGRIVFNDGDRTKTEIGQFVELPEWIWEGGFVECSRVATVPDIRGRDVFADLSKHTGRIARQAGVKYLLADCEDHLLAPYKRRGAKELGVTFTHPLEGKKLHVIYYETGP